MYECVWNGRADYLVNGVERDWSVSPWRASKSGSAQLANVRICIHAFTGS
jgi:hypothetical protein